MKRIRNGTTSALDRHRWQPPATAHEKGSSIDLFTPHEPGCAAQEVAQVSDHIRCIRLDRSGR